MTMAEKTEKTELKPARRVLAPVGPCADPAIQQIVAERETAKYNGDNEQVKALTARLAELGYE